MIKAILGQVVQIGLGTKVYNWVVAACAAIWAYTLPTEALRVAAVSAGTLILLDTVLGVAIAFRDHKISSSGFAKVIYKIIAYSATVLAVSSVVRILPTDPHWQSAAVSAVLALIVCREFLSVTEHAGILAPSAVPDWVKTRVASIIEDTNKGPFEEKKETI